MALKSKEWFFKHCLRHALDGGPLAPLSRDLLEKGIGQSNSTRGHVGQAIGAVQRFFERFPHHMATIRGTPASRPFNLPAHAAMRRDWATWLAAEHAGRAASRGAYGRGSFGYNIWTLRGILPPNLGGTRLGGGGGGDEFKKVLRLLPEFWGRP